MSSHPSLDEFLTHHIPSPQRTDLRQTVIPTLLHGISNIATCLRTSLSIQTAGSTNTSGDTQLNVDLATNAILHAAIQKCPSIISASSEEDAGENAVQHDPSSAQQQKSDETYAVAFDPLDGSSIIPANWSVGTIIGLWDGPSALHQVPRTKQVAAILGVLGPRTTAIVAIRLPETYDAPLCFEVGLEGERVVVLREEVRFKVPEEVTTRYFAPANLRAAARDAAYKGVLEYFIEREYTLRYSGGLVPDVVHALVKGHGVYVSPVTGGSAAKLRRLYEVVMRMLRGE